MATSKKKILLVSPAKSGTHFLVKILQNSNLYYKGKIDICSEDSGYYSLTNTFHTSFKKFFYNLDKDAPYGGRLLPIKSSLGIVNCRHPADIFYSYLNYSFKDDNTSFSNITFQNQKDQIEFVYENKFYEDFFKSLYDYTAWSHLDNFITLSFENLVEIASKEKKQSIHEKILDFTENQNIYETIKTSFKSSNTYFKAKIGEGSKFIKENYPLIFEDQYYKKYCDFYGYDHEQAGPPTKLNILNDKNIKIFDDRPKNVQITIQDNFYDHNIVYFNNEIFAMPFDIDVKKISKYLGLFLKAKSLDEIKYKILKNDFKYKIKKKIINFLCK